LTARMKAERSIKFDILIVSTQSAIGYEQLVSASWDSIPSGKTGLKQQNFRKSERGWVNVSKKHLLEQQRTWGNPPEDPIALVKTKKNQERSPWGGGLRHEDRSSEDMKSSPCERYRSSALRKGTTLGNKNNNGRWRSTKEGRASPQNRRQKIRRQERKSPITPP